MRFRSSVWLIAMVLLCCRTGLAATCQDPVSTSLSAGSLPNAVQLTNGTTAQPLGGTLIFTLPTTALSKDGPPLFVCFRWRPRDQTAELQLKDKDGHKEKDKDRWSENLPLRVLTSQSDITTVSVEIPSVIAGIEADTLSHKTYAYDGLWPVADFRVMIAGASGTATLDEVLPVNISSYWISAAVAALATLAFWLVIWGLGHYGKKKVPGGFLLSIICNQNGYASLSQFQIMVWTIVIGAASIYIVVLTGRLLDIPTQTLGLLGIAGAATVAAVVPKAGDGKATTPPAAPQPPPPTAPGVATDLKVAGGPGETTVVLSWGPPDGGGPATSYAVEQRTAAQGQAAGAWGPAPNGAAVTEAPFTITALAPNTRYQFRVTASNTGVPGPPTEPTVPVTTLQAGAGAAMPAQVLGARPAGGAARADSVTLEWNPLAPIPEAYVVRFRRAGAGVWTVNEVTGPNASSSVVDELSADIDYEFHVLAVTSGQSGPASAIVTARTAVREPQFMDLVVWDGTHEIDVTRLQMLFFTLVAAMFVAVKVVAENEIPDIPQGLLLLMGISNGVYLSSKFVSGRR
jgi:hypothetical protein